MTRAPGAGVTWSAVSTAIVGALGLLGLVVVARGVGPEGYAAFSVLWAVFFGFGGVFAGLQQEVTRSVRVRGRPRKDEPELVPLVLLVVIPVAALGTVAALDMSYGLMATSVPLFLGLGGLGCLCYIGGVLAARARWSRLAQFLMLDATVRTAALALVVWTGNVSMLPTAVASGSMIWAAVLVVPACRGRLAARASTSAGGFLVRCLLAMVSTGCAALVVSGIPVLLALVRPAFNGVEAGELLAALTIVRSSLLLVVYGYRPLMLRHFLHQSRPGRALLIAWAACLAVGAVFAALVATLGPSVLGVLLGPSFDVGTLECAQLALGAVGVMFLVVSGLALVARDEHLASTAGWVLALSVSVTLLACFGSTRHSVLAAALVGPWVGVVLHGVLASRAFGRSRNPSQAELR